MEIRIDTALMKQMACNSTRAKFLLEEAMEAANATVIHDDWNCSERDLINENVLKVKKHSKILCESMESYSSKLNELATKFEEFDRMLCMNFSGFDSSIGQLYQIECPENVGVHSIQSFSENELEQMLSLSGATTYWERYHVSNLTTPISVLDFSDSVGILEGFNAQ